MRDASHSLVAGGPVRILAPNPGPMTLEGTNTWVLPGIVGEPAVVVDPGPADLDHLARVRTACPEGISEIWLTHHHDDHTGGAERLAVWTNAVVRAADPRLSQTDPFQDGERSRIGGHEVLCVTLPGHTADSLGFVEFLPGGAVLFTGDTILGRGTALVAWPDGNLGQYLATLDKIDGLIERWGISRLLPGHGPEITDPGACVGRYRHHRLRRLDQIREAYASGRTSVGSLVDAVYGDVVGATRQAAELNVRAQLEYLGLA